MKYFTTGLFLAIVALVSYIHLVEFAQATVKAARLSCPATLVECAE